jgi:ELWxxDGT repeat protein
MTAAPVIIGSAALSSGKVAVLAGNYVTAAQFDDLQVAILSPGGQTTLSSTGVLSFPSGGSPNNRPNPTGGAAIAALPGGGMAIESWGGTNADYYVQILNNAGTVTTSPLVIGTANVGGIANLDPYNPGGAVAAWTGGVVVAWRANDESLDKFDRLSNAGSIIGSTVTFASTSGISTHWGDSLAVDNSGNVILGFGADDVYTHGSFALYNAGNTLVATGTVDGLEATPLFAALPGGGFITVGYVPTSSFGASGYAGFNLTIQTISPTGTVTRVKTVDNAYSSGDPPDILNLAVSSTGTLVFQEPYSNDYDTYVIATGSLTRDAIPVTASDITSESSGTTGGVYNAGTAGADDIAVETLIGGVAAGPTLTAGATATFIGGGAAVVLDAGLILSDNASTTLVSATIDIASGFYGGDALNVLPPGGLSRTYDSAHGTLTLSGTASLATYQTALDSIVYEYFPVNDDPTDGGGDTSRTITWTVNDGSTSSTPVTSTLDVVHVAPTLAAAGTVTYTGGGAAVVLDAAVSLSDVDSGGILTGATVIVAGGFLAGDTLGFIAQNGISGTYVAGTGVLTLSGAATIANYQSALASITYSSTAADPTSGTTDVSRSIDWTISDGSTVNGTSPLSTSTVNIAHTGTGELFFNARNAGGLAGLWVSDGSAAGTSELVVANASSFGVGPVYLAPFQGEVYFSGSDPNTHRQLWASNGTAAGTSELAVTNSSTLGLTPEFLTSVGATLYFNGDPTTGLRGLWVSNGTAAGTSELVVANSSSLGLNPQSLMGFVGKLYFSGGDSSNDFGLWVSNGTAAGTSELTVVGANTTNFDPADITVYDGKLYFEGENTAGLNQLWVSDGTAAGTSALAVAGAYADGLQPQNLTVFDGKLYFTGFTSGGAQDLWMSDGTAAGTSLLNVANAATSAFLPSYLTVFNGKLYFEGEDANSHEELWASDGTAAGTTELAVAGASASGLVPQYLTVLGNALYFEGKNTAGLYELWVSDGTAAGTSQLAVAGTDAAGFNPSRFVVLNVPPSGPTVVAGAVASFTGGGAPVALDPGLTVGDVASTTLAGATVAISGGFVAGDTLNFATQNGIAGSYNSATGTLTLSGTASLAFYQTALESITYSFTAGGDPTNGGAATSRTLSWTVTDGTTPSSAAASTLTIVHAAPTVAAAGTVSFSGGGAAVALDPTLTVSDPDSGGLLASATIAISTGFLAGDTLNFLNLKNGITGSYNSGTGVLTLTGSASIANYQSALDTVTFSFSPVDGDPTRGITWLVNDGVAASSAGSSVLDTVHVAPSVTAGGTVTYDTGGAAVALDAGINVGDVDSGGDLAGATVAIASGLLAGDTLNFTGQNGITGSYNSGTGVLTLTSKATVTVANYQSALATVTYSSTAADPTDGGTDLSRALHWTVTDGVAASNAGTSVLDISPPAPVITAGATASFTGGGGPVVLDSGLTISDLGSATLAGATIAIGSMLAGDTLNFSSQNGIIGNYSTATGTLTLSGTATLADYQSALDGITYSFSPSNGDPTDAGTDASRTLSWVVSDGTHSSTATTSTLDIVHAAPTITAGGTVAFSGGGMAVALDPTLTLSDPDSNGLLASATVAISAGFLSGDTLNFANQSGITGSYNTATGVLALTGSATIANYQSALDAVTFSVAPADGDPTGGGTDASRGITWLVNDGVAASSAGSSVLDTVHVAPTVTAGGTVTFAGGGTAVALDPTLTVGDPDSNDLLASATVVIATGFLAGDTIGFSKQDGITGTYDSGSGVLTLSGAASVATYQSALDTLTFSFSPADGDPTGGGGDASRSIAWSVNDGVANSGTGTSALEVVHVAPTVSASGTVTFIGGGTAVALDPTLALNDADSGGDLVGATVTIGAGFRSGDTLAYANLKNGITGSYDSGAGVLMLSGTASIATYQSALETVTFSFSPADGDPTGGGGDASRSIAWSVNDGVANSATGSSALDVVHAAPTVSAAGTVAFPGGGVAVTLYATLALSDPDSLDQLAGATVAIDGFLAGDTLNFVDQNGITGTYDATSGVLSLSGTASIAAYQAALDSVTYDFSPTDGDPTDAGTDPDRSIAWTVTDGVAASNAGTSTLQDLHTAPTLTAGGTANFSGGGPAVALDPTLALNDADSFGTLASATIAIAAGFLGGDTLNFTAQNGITGSYDSGSGVLTLSGAASISNYQSALETITYDFSPANGDPTDAGSDPDRRIVWTINDGVAVSNAGTSTLQALHTAPTLNAAGTASFSGGGAAVTLDPTLTLGDPDSAGTLASATIAIAAGFLAGDTLGFAAQDGIVGNYNTATGVLTLTGSASIANYQSALEAITYDFAPTDADPTDTGSDPDRRIVWTLDDGVAASNTGTSTLDVLHAPPTLTAAGTAAFTIAGPAVTLDPLLTLTDPDSSGLLSGASVAITAGTFAGDGDTLSATVTGTAISVSYDPGSETLTLSGSDSLADYQTVLRSVTYASSNADPTDGGDDPSRGISWSASDAVATATAATSSVSFAQPPVPTVTAVTATPANADLDAGHLVSFTLALSAPVSVSGGTPSLTLNDGGSASFDAADSTATALVFTYLVAGGQNVPDLAVTGVVLNSATIIDAYAQAADLSGAVANPAGILQIDTTAPAAPGSPALSPASDSGSEGDGITDLAAPTLTGTATAGDTITLYDGTIAVGSTVAGEDGTWSIVTSPLGLGAATLTATETDPAGNVSAAPAQLDLTIVPLPASPAGLALAPASDSGIQGDDATDITTPAITGTGTPGDTVVLYDGATSIGSGTVTAGGTWSIVAATLADGVHPLSATETDPYGDISATSATLDITIAVPLAPAALTLAPASDSGVAGDDITRITTPDITGTGAPDDRVTLYDGAAVIGTGTVAAGGTWSIVTTVLAAGAQNLTATQTDQYGDTSSASAPLALLIDTAAAAPSVTQTADSTDPAEPLLIGTAPDGAGVTIYQDGSAIGTAAADTTGAWSFAFPSVLAAGTYDITATDIDVAGNVSSLSATLEVQVAADDSYAIVSPPTPSGETTTRDYDPTGQFTAVSTVNGSGQLLESVSTTQAVLEIYDAAGNLIGTVTQPSSSPATQPSFTTQGLPLAASTTSGPVGSQIDLLAESNVITSAGNDTISAGPGADTIMATGPSTSVAGGSGTLLFIAQGGASTVSGGSGSATVFGGTGGGVVAGGSAGRNILVAVSGNTTLLGGGSDDTVVGGGGSALLALQPGGVGFGGAGTTTVFGGGDTLVGGGGSNVMVGDGDGGDTMFGGSGQSTMFAGSGDATMVGGSGRTVMVAGPGTDLLVGGPGAVTAFGGSGSDVFFATGGGGTDISAGTGPAEVVLGAGATTVTGGSGPDLYDVTNGVSDGGIDVIAGFKVGTDHLRLFGYGPAAPQFSGGNAVISLSDGTTITLLGISSLEPSSVI